MTLMVNKTKTTIPQQVATTGQPEHASAAQIASQLESCSRRNPYAFIRFSAYNPSTQQTAMSFVAKTPQEGQ